MLAPLSVLKFAPWGKYDVWHSSPEMSKCRIMPGMSVPVELYVVYYIYFMVNDNIFIQFPFKPAFIFSMAK